MKPRKQMQKHQNKKKIFCLGLSKTGTTSLGSLLEEAGYNHKSGPGKLGLLAWKHERYDVIDSICSEHDSFADLPWPFLYEYLANKYSQSYFVLTRRLNETVWYQSLEKHWERRGWSENLRIAYGITDLKNKERTLKALYNAHNLAVNNYFKNDDRFIDVCIDDHAWGKKIGNHLGFDKKITNAPHCNKSSGRSHAENVEKLLKMDKYGHALYYIDRYCPGDKKVSNIVNSYIDSLAKNERRKKGTINTIKRLLKQ